MLILTRKSGESITIGDDVKITVVEVKGKQVRIGIDAPRSYIIHREEVYISIQEENRRAAEESPLSLAGIKNLLGKTLINKTLMLVQTSRFGEIEVKDDQIISFPSGLIGFSEDHRFVIREDEAAAPFRWLQSIDSEDLAFVMIEPHVSISNYELELTNDHLKKLHAEKTDDLLVYSLVTMAKKMEDVTINLQGPLLFNLEKRLGIQIIVQDGRYSTRHSLFAEKLKKSTPESSSQEEPENSSKSLEQAG